MKFTYFEESQNFKNGLFLGLITLFNLLFALFLYTIRYSLKLESIFILILSLLIYSIYNYFVSLFIMKRINYNYKKIKIPLILIILIISYILLAVFFFNTTVAIQDYIFNIKKYVEVFIDSFNNYSGFNAAVYFVSITGFAFNMYNLFTKYEEKTNFLATDEGIKSIKETKTYIKTFTNKIDLENYIEKLKSNDKNGLLNLNDFEFIGEKDLNKLKKEEKLIIRKIEFNDTDVFKIIVTKLESSKRINYVNIKVYEKPMYYNIL